MTRLARVLFILFFLVPVTTGAQGRFFVGQKKFSFFPRFFTLAQPDLLVESFSLEESTGPFSGEGALVATLQNGGLRESSSTSVKVFETTRPSGCPKEWQPREVISLELPSLASGGESEFSVEVATVTLVENPCALYRSFHVVVDPEDQVTESNEDNNSGTTSYFPDVVAAGCGWYCGRCNDGPGSSTCGLCCSFPLY